MLLAPGTGLPIAAGPSPGPLPQLPMVLPSHSPVLHPHPVMEGPRQLGGAARSGAQDVSSRHVGSQEEPWTPCPWFGAEGPWQGRSSSPARVGRWGLGLLGALTVPSTALGAGTAQRRCLQCLEQRLLLAGCAANASARSPSQPQQHCGPSVSQAPLTLPCLRSSRCHIPLPRHLAGAKLWGTLCCAEPWAPGGGCPARGGYI